MSASVVAAGRGSAEDRKRWGNWTCGCSLASASANGLAAMAVVDSLGKGTGRGSAGPAVGITIVSVGAGTGVVKISERTRFGWSRCSPATGRGWVPGF